jgi:CubicO group peptidase (beta-lactamase class C family)
MKSLCRCVILLVMISQALQAQSPVPPRDLAPTLKPLAEKYNLPGVVGAIVHGNQIVAIGAVGVRKFGDPTPFLATDTIHLGSDTKAMTAILIGQLIDSHQLTLDTTMKEAFPDFAADMNPEMAKVTVRNLLTHTAGFAHDLNWRALEQMRVPLTEQRKWAVKQALSDAPANPIGKYFYSNISFVLLGAIVEAKTGESWEDVMRRKIFDPLKMTTAGFGPPSMAGAMDQPWGHVLDGGKLKPVQFDNAPVLGPAGTVHCSISDWAKFVSAILQLARGHSGLISAATFAQLSTPLPGQSYAGGWLVTKRPWAGGRTLTHSGSNTSWYCTVWIAPDKDFALLVATNDGASPAGEAMDKGIGELIHVNSQLGGTP